LDEEQSLTIWGWSGAPGADAMQDVIDAFTQVHPNISVTYNEIANTDYANKAALGLSSGQEIDVIGVFPNEWAKDNESYLLPVSEWDTTGDLSAELSETSVEQTSKIFSDGILRAVPAYSSGDPVFFYNVDLLKEAGLAEPPATWDDVKKLTEGLESTEPDVATAIIPQDGWFQSSVGLAFIQEFDPTYWNKFVYDQGEWNTDAASQGLNLYQQIFSDGTLDKSTLDISYSDAKTNFGEGKTAMVMSGTWDAGLLSEGYREANGFDIDNVGAVAIPSATGSEGGIRSYVDLALGIPTASEHQEAAAAFIEFMVAGEGVDKWASSLLGVPAKADWTIPDGLLTSEQAVEGWKTIQNLVANPQSDRFVLSNFENQQGSYFLEVARGSMTPDEALTAGEQDASSGKYF
jgi:raffinose/stachyose/melibiose transport system substrate-binding protein